MPHNKTVAVVEATGEWGPVLVKAILNDPSGQFSARAITRSAASDNARAMAVAGAEGIPDNLFRFKRDFEGYFCGARSLEFSKGLNPELKTFQQWLATNVGRIPLSQFGFSVRSRMQLNLRLLKSYT